MIVRLLQRTCCHRRILQLGSTMCVQGNPYSQNNITLNYLCKYLNITENQAKFLQLKNRGLNRLHGEEIKNLVKVINELGYPSDVLVEEPTLFSMLPITLKFRHKVLKECGVLDLSAKHIVTYFPLLKQKTVGELKESGVISPLENIENKLANCMTQWPTSITTLVYGNVDNLTLYSLRLKIIQRYLELVLDLTEVEFYRGLKTYQTLKHRPLAVINETVEILQTQVLMPAEKIKSNFYLLHADPENLKNIIFKLKSIGGIDIKDILRMHPKLAIRNYTLLLKMRQLFEEYGITNEAQRRCFQIYSLGPDTVRERLERAKRIPEFNSFLTHPRFLKMIHYENKAMKRLRNLYEMDKKCLTLNILSGSSAHYEVFEKAPGDRLGKGKDLVFCICKLLGNTYSMSNVRRRLKRHPFWVNIPLVQVTYVFGKLSNEFSTKDIYENCPILLYPWNKVKEVIKMISKDYQNNNTLHIHEYLDLQSLNKSQKLSLALYFLEKNHYFTGNGVWNEEKNKNVDNVLNVPVNNKSVLIQYIYILFVHFHIFNSHLPHWLLVTSVTADRVVLDSNAGSALFVISNLDFLVMTWSLNVLVHGNSLTTYSLVRCELSQMTLNCTAPLCLTLQKLQRLLNLVVI